MSAISYESNLLIGLSDFWQRFFSDADQLSAMYQGAAFLMGQAYVDMLANVLSLSLADCPVNIRQYWKLFPLREDQVKFVAGASPADDRWVAVLPKGVVALTLLNNKVFEPTASLQLSNDFDVSNGNIAFRTDPTNPNGTGTPLDGYARRVAQVSVGGRFTDSLVPTWVGVTPVKKGDVIRLVYVSTAGQHSKISDHVIVLVRKEGLYVSADTPLPPPATGVKYVILRRPASYQITLEQMVFVGSTATLVHGRVVNGSVLVYAKRQSDGADVVEGTDYTIDYEAGTLMKLTAWTVTSINKIDYQWLQPVWPLIGPDPRKSNNGVIRPDVAALAAEMTMWAPDVLVDKLLLSNNFGAMIGSSSPSSEGYRAFLRGIFQLYILGPVLERIESAMNVVLGLPVVRDDGEILKGFEAPTADHPTTNRVITSRAGRAATYDYPTTVPLRSDVQNPANFGVMVLGAFDTLTTAVTVTDYIQDPNWWHNILLPPELFSPGLNGSPIPEPSRRIAASAMVANVAGAEDDPKAGDPGLYAGADDEGFQPPPGHTVYRHRVGFTIMDRFLKRHIFYVKFDTAVFSLPGAFVKDADELRRLIIDARPAHTYAYVQPATAFDDQGTFHDGSDEWFQSQAAGVDPSLPEIYTDPVDAPLATPTPSQLGLFLSPALTIQENDVLWQDSYYVAGVNGWLAGDFSRYVVETGTVVNFTAIGLPFTITAVVAPERRRIVRAYLDGSVGGNALVEGADYSVDYAANTVTRLTAWDSNTVTITAVLVSIRNFSFAALSAADGDRPAQAGEIDAALVRADYGGPGPEAADDLSGVERSLTIKVS